MLTDLCPDCGMLKGIVVDLAGPGPIHCSSCHVRGQGVAAFTPEELRVRAVICAMLGHVFDPVWCWRCGEIDFVRNPLVELDDDLLQAYQKLKARRDAETVDR